MKVVAFDHPATVLQVAFNHDGSRVLSVCADGRVRLWEKQRPGDAVPWIMTARPLPHPAWVTAAEFSPDGSMVLTGCLDRSARLWDAHTGDPLGTPLLHEHPVQAVAFRPDGKLLVTATGQFQDNDSKNTTGRLRFWKPDTCQPFGPEMHHRGPVKTLAFSPNGRVLASGGIVVDPDTEKLSGALHLWNADDRADSFPPGHPCLPAPIDHPLPVRAVAFSPDGRVIATGSEDRHLRCFHTATGAPLGAPVLAHGTVTKIRFSPDGWLLFHNALSSDGAAHILNAPRSPAHPELLRAPDALHRTAYSPDGTRLLLAGDFGAYLVDCTTRNRLLTVEDARTPVHGAAFDPQGKWLATGDLGGQVTLRDQTTGVASPIVLKGPNFPVFQLSFDPAGKTLLVWHRDHGKNAVTLWTPDGITLFHHLRHLDHCEIMAVAFGGDGQLIRVVERRHGEIHVTTWDRHTQKPLHTWTAPHRGKVYNFSPDGRWLLEANVSSRLLDADTGASPRPLMISPAWVKNAAFSPDGKLLALMDITHTVRLWDVETCKPVGGPLHHPGAADRLSFSPAGDEFLLFGVDNLVYRWSVPRPRPGTAASIRHWLEYRTGAKLSEHNHVQPLDSEQLRQRYQFLRQLNAPLLPADPALPPVSAAPAPTPRPLALPPAPNPDPAAGDRRGALVDA